MCVLTKIEPIVHHFRGGDYRNDKFSILVFTLI